MHQDLRVQCVLKTGYRLFERLNFSFVPKKILHRIRGTLPAAGSPIHSDFFYELVQLCRDIHQLGGNILQIALLLAKFLGSSSFVERLH